VLGTFEVLGDMPEHARQGLFASPATYPAYVRFSNGAGTKRSDTKGDVRGVAVKVVGVPGKKVIPGMEDKATQDFLLIRTPAIPFRDAHEFVAVVTAAANPALLLPRVIARLGFGRAFELLPKLSKGLGIPMPSLATGRWFSAAPIRFGAHAVHCALDPQRGGDDGAPDATSPDYLHADLAARLSQRALSWDFRVQFYVDETRTPIEDASVEWKESDAPFVTVARLTLPQQDLASPRGRKIASFIETLSFDPWHAKVEHRPLGGIMRARNHAYRLSTEERRAAAEPDGSERWD
jgi:hypothetical protein